MSSRDSATWMWAEACDMLDRADRLRRQFFRLAGEPGPAPTWEPPVDVVETPGELFILAALPGVDPRAVEILIDGTTIRITASRPMPDFLARARIHRLEIPYGRFERVIDLGERSLLLTRREAINGCLVLVFDKHD